MSARRRGRGDRPPPEPHAWSTLGYRGIGQSEGRAGTLLASSRCTQIIRSSDDGAVPITAR